ncbi:metal ABC transporter permease [Vibrio sp. HN007]|uniref:metal ABC transporter permease n=1 Tax=Vibrio iocasae TaxID=3098914 RepID=UPI0035D4B784
MFEMLVEPLQYEYMRNALYASALVGTVCAFLSAFLVLKGWSLIGDALSHAVVPGVAGAYILGLPFSVGAFFSGFLAAGAILFVKQVSSLREDAIIGFVFTTFFSAGILMISLYPTSINIESVILGNILMLGDSELFQIFLIGLVSMVLLGLFWKDLALTFFDENQAASVGISTNKLKILFFALLSASTVASLQAVGAVLVIALVIIPGATAYQLTDRFGKMIVISCVIGGTTSLAGAYLSYFLDGVTGGVIVLLQALVFFSVLALAPKYGLLRQFKVRLLSKEQSHA